MTEMRKVLAEELEISMAKNKKIVVLDADLGKANGTIGIRNKYPERAFDVGIAEQNMASVAAGLSSYGFIPFISSFTPFCTRRICDQIAISIAYAKQNVKIIGTDPGITAELNGGTHMSFADIGVLRSIPDIVIFEPVDEVQLKKSIPQIINYYGPVYVRMVRKETPVVFESEKYEFDLFKNDLIKSGKDITIVCSGIMVKEVIDADKELQKRGIDAEIINVHTIKPLETETLIKSIRKTKAIVTVENHNVIGGLRSSIAEFLTEENLQYPMKYIGINDRFGTVGTIPELKKYFSLDTNHIIEKVEECIKLKGI